MMMDLKVFFEEKDIPLTSWEIEHNGETHFIDSEYVIEAVLATQGNERTKIAGVLFALDIKNASIVDYLRFLAECMIKHNCDCEDNKH
jgi:hypothetical protein